MAHRLPTVIVPVFNCTSALDNCLALLSQTLPSNARVWVADDASSDPRVEALVRSWCYQNRLDANYVRREHSLGLAVNRQRALAECADCDVVLLDPGAVLTPGWLERIADMAARDKHIASLQPWSNRSDTCAFSVLGERDGLPRFPELISEAAASVSWDYFPELPSSDSLCLYLRRDALSALGTLDTDTYAGSHAAVIDWCLRAAAMGWRNVLCSTVFIGCRDDAPFIHDDAMAGHDMRWLVARWPHYQEQAAQHFLSDPLRPLRQQVLARMEQIKASGPQADLFG